MSWCLLRPGPYDVVFDEDVFPFTDLSSTAEAHYTSEVLLLPAQTSSQGAADLPVANTHAESSLFSSYLWTNDALQPQTIQANLPA
jgi:hypothetical protein